MKTALIRQPAGMGDILFCQKIARLLLDKKRVDRVIWPVIKEYEYIKDYVQYPNLTFINETHDFDFKQYYQTEYSHLYENDELMVSHAIMHFPDGTKEAVLSVHILKDGLIFRTETGATLVD